MGQELCLWNAEIIDGIYGPEMPFLFKKRKKREEKKEKKGKTTISLEWTVCYVPEFLNHRNGCFSLKSVFFTQYLEGKLSVVKNEIVLKSNHGWDFNRLSVHNTHAMCSSHYNVRFS